MASNTSMLETSSPFEVARTPGLRDEVVLAIEKAVLAGSIAPGQRLVEITIAKQMGISKAPVREALRELERLGLVVSYPRRGTFVAEITPTVASEMYSFRAVIEAYAARLAVSRVTAADLASMEALLEEADRDGASDEAAVLRRVDLDLAFHDEIYRLSGHHLLQDAWGNLRTRIRVLLVVSGMLHEVDSSRSGEQPRYGRHAAIVRALRAGDADLAEAAIISQLAAGERGLVSRLGGDPSCLRVGPEATARRPDLALLFGDGSATHGVNGATGSRDASADLGRA